MRKDSLCLTMAAVFCAAMLIGCQKAPEVKEAKFKEVWKNYSHALSELKAGDSAIIRMKEQAENAMYQGVSRTERISVMDSGDYTDDSSVKHHLQIDENDINSYIQMSRLLSKTDSNHSLPVDYAKSCPYLMSFMKKYKSRLKNIIQNIRMNLEVKENKIFYG